MHETLRNKLKSLRPTALWFASAAHTTRLVCSVAWRRPVATLPARSCGRCVYGASTVCRAVAGGAMGLPSLTPLLLALWVEAVAAALGTLPPGAFIVPAAGWTFRNGTPAEDEVLSRGAERADCESRPADPRPVSSLRSLLLASVSKYGPI